MSKPRIPNIPSLLEKKAVTINKPTKILISLRKKYIHNNLNSYLNHKKK